MGISVSVLAVVPAATVAAETGVPTDDYRQASCLRNVGLTLTSYGRTGTVRWTNGAAEYTLTLHNRGRRTCGVGAGAMRLTVKGPGINRTCIPNANGVLPIAKNGRATISSTQWQQRRGGQCFQSTSRAGDYRIRATVAGTPRPSNVLVLRAAYPGA
ncbi:MAG: hypothetical protein QM662_11175 [Gordonia sp. (in: high G+C Gram-positive bacteria)]